MNEPVPSLPAVLTFAATDPTSGAGLQADLLALASMGCYPLSVVTALTVQDTAGVESFLAIDPDWVADQARCILEDMPVAAFKMGMLGSTEIVTVVAEVVSDYPDVPLVLDPVFASGPRRRVRGRRHGRRRSASCWCRRAPWSRPTSRSCGASPARTTTTTRTSPNARSACSTPAASTCSSPARTTRTADVVNTLYHRGGVLRADTWQRLPGSYHGSGCTLASALAANLARGLDIGDAVYEAQDYTWQALAHAFRPGMGQYLPDRLFWARETRTTTAMTSERARACAGSTRSRPGSPTPRALVARVRACLEGGAALVQYRAKDVDPGLALEQARRARARCAAPRRARSS